MKIKKIVPLLILILLLVGISSAAEVSEDTTAIDTADKVADDTSSITGSADSTLVKQTEDNKETVKDEKNVKTASKTYDVNDYNTLRNSLTSNGYDTVTVNIRSDIKLSGSIRLNDAVKKLTINANGKKYIVPQSIIRTNIAAG